MYHLIISPKAQKQLKNIKLSHQLAVKLALEDIKEDPTIGKPLTRELMNWHSYRVAIYRIIYKVNKKDNIIYILTAAHRAIVYK